MTWEGLARVVAAGTDKLGAANAGFLRTTGCGAGADSSGAGRGVTRLLTVAGAACGVTRLLTVAGAACGVTRLLAAGGAGIDTTGAGTGLRAAGAAGTMIVSGAAGLGIAARLGLATGAGSGAASTARGAAVVVGTMIVSTGESVCATTRPLLRRPKPPIILSPCISRGYR